MRVVLQSEICVLFVLSQMLDLVSIYLNCHGAHTKTACAAACFCYRSNIWENCKHARAAHFVGVPGCFTSVHNAQKKAHVKKHMNTEGVTHSTTGTSSSQSYKWSSEVKVHINTKESGVLDGITSGSTGLIWLRCWCRVCTPMKELNTKFVPHFSTNCDIFSHTENFMLFLCRRSLGDDGAQRGAKSRKLNQSYSRSQNNHLQVDSRCITLIAVRIQRFQTSQHWNICK